MLKLISFSSAFFMLSVSLSSAQENAEYKLNGLALDIDGTKSYSEKIMRPEELKTCLDQSDKLTFLNKILNSQSDGFDAKLKKINKLAEEVEKSQAYLDANPTREINDDAKMAARNQKVRLHNDLVNQYNTHLAAYEKETKNYNQNNAKHTELMESFSKNCASKHYYREDLDAILVSR